MPALLLRFLPHIGIILAVLAGVWYIGHLGEKRAENRLERERLAQAIMWEKQVRRIEEGLAESVAAIDANTGTQIATIQHTDRTIIQPAIEREIRREVQLSDPALGLPDGLREAINAARQLSSSTGPASELTVALPAPEPTQ